MKNNEGTFVSALVDHLMCTGDRENINEVIMPIPLFFVIIKDKRNINGIVKEPKTMLVYIATQLLIPKIPNEMDNMNGHPMDLG